MSEMWLFLHVRAIIRELNNQEETVLYTTDIVFNLCVNTCLVDNINVMKIHGELRDCRNPLDFGKTSIFCKNHRNPNRTEVSVYIFVLL